MDKIKTFAYCRGDMILSIMTMKTFKTTATLSVSLKTAKYSKTQTISTLTKRFK